MSSFEDIGKELRPQNLYDVKSDLFLARMTVRVNEVTRNAIVVLQRDPNNGNGHGEVLPRPLISAILIRAGLKV